jgi:hypothetical protein
MAPQGIETLMEFDVVGQQLAVLGEHPFEPLPEFALEDFREVFEHFLKNPHLFLAGLEFVVQPLGRGRVTDHHPGVGH